MAGNINFSQKEIDSLPVSGTELDRYLIQGDQIAMNPESLIKMDSQLNAVEIPIGLDGQILKVIAGAIGFSDPSDSILQAADGHFEIKGLIINWNKVTTLAAGASAIVTYSKPFTTLSFGSFTSVEDAINNVPVQLASSTLTEATIKNFDALNAAGVVYVFSIGY